jgi:protocatechuate 3,4-dioxygenase beta subunit
VSSAGTPLAGEGVMVEHDGRLEALRRRRFARTGADGRARVGGLDAGSVRVHSGRGGDVRADVPAGGVGSVRVALERGVTVEGVVVDAEGAPVPAAGLFVDVGGAGKLSCLQVGITDHAGRFRLEDVAAFASVSARRPGRTPSGARRVAGQPGQSDRMKLVIGGPGAAVRGTVVDAEGRPVAGAVVFVGQAFPPPMALPDGGHGTGPSGVAAWTDVRGEFEVDPVEPAETSVTVRAAGHAPYRRPTTLVAGLNTVEVTLGTPYAIEGRVVTPDGAPAAGATVRSQDDHDAMWSWATVAAADGRFRLDDLPSEHPGGWSLVLELRHPTGRAELTVRAPWPPGVTTLLRAARIRVRVEDELGRPLADRDVHAGAHGAPVGTTSATTDAEGRAVLEVGAWALYTVGLTARDRAPHAPTVERSGVRPDAGEVVLVERGVDRAAAHVTARIVAPERLPDGALAWAMRAGARTGVNLTLDPATGVLTGPALAPGRYELSMSAVGYGNVPLGIVRLKRDATLDLGEVRLASPGRLVVNLRGTPGLLKSGGGIQAVGPRGSVWSRPAADGSATFDLLQPGPWDVVVPGWPHDLPTLGATAVRVEVTSGATTTIDIKAPRGHVRTLRPTGPLPVASGGLAVDVHADGATVPLARFMADGTSDHPAPTFQVALEPGRYVADAETGDGRRVSVPFEVRGDGEPPVEVELPR